MKRLYYQLMIVLVMTSMSLSAQNTPKTEMEKLSRGVVALPSRSKGCFISWRLLGTDDERVKFNLVRNGKIIASNLSYATDYNDDNGDSTCSYQVETVSDGKVVSASELVKPWRDIYMKLKLDRPAADVTAMGEHYSYCPNDCSVGDVDEEGCDEITFGSAAIDNNGDLLYSTGLGHGDAIHLGDMEPDRKGLEVYMAHEKISGATCVMQKRANFCCVC